MDKAEAGKIVYERHMRKLGATLLPKRFLPDGEVLLAERYIIFDDVPYYETFWMVHRNGIDLGRSVRTPAYTTSLSGITLPIPVASRQEDRIQEAMVDAIGWIEMNKRTKRYG